MKYHVRYAAYPTLHFEYDLEEIRRRVTSGEMPSDTTIRENADQQWVPVGNVADPRVAKPARFSMIQLRSNGTQSGPFTESQIRSMWSTGAITADTEYAYEGSSAWQLLRTLLEPPQKSPKPEASGEAVFSKPFLYTVSVLVLTPLLLLSGVALQSNKKPALSKVAWINKMPNSQLLSYSRTLIGDKRAIYTVVGEPINIRTYGRVVELTWKCSDGSIVVECDDSAFNTGTIIGKVFER